MSDNWSNEIAAALRPRSDGQPGTLVVSLSPSKYWIKKGYFLISHIFTELVKRASRRLELHIQTRLSKCLVRDNFITSIDPTKVTPFLLDWVSQGRFIFACSNESTYSVIKNLPESVRNAVRYVYFTGINTRQRSQGDPNVGDPFWDSTYRSSTGVVTHRLTKREEDIRDWFPNIKTVSIDCYETLVFSVQYLREAFTIIPKPGSAVELVHRDKEFMPSLEIWSKLKGNFVGCGIDEAGGGVEYTAINPGRVWPREFNRYIGSEGWVGLKVERLSDEEVLKRGRFVRTWGWDDTKEVDALEERYVWRATLVRISEALWRELSEFQEAGVRRPITTALL
ncbi:hypothetical protein TWF694_001301 [Orbilia ellipsospora]|uniref:Uncharacterized protein n=1 Tax=Orbilia ellipsospora TaxID=2528407 RepID=A0AAV9XRE3_9PEZI